MPYGLFSKLGYLVWSFCERVPYYIGDLKMDPNFENSPYTICTIADPEILFRLSLAPSSRPLVAVILKEPFSDHCRVSYKVSISLKLAAVVLKSEPRKGAKSCSKA